MYLIPQNNNIIKILKKALLKLKDFICKIFFYLLDFSIIIEKISIFIFYPLFHLQSHKEKSWPAGEIASRQSKTYEIWHKTVFVLRTRNRASTRTNP